MMEPDIKEQVDEGVYEEQVAMMEMVVEVEALIDAVKGIREQHSKL